MKALRYPVILIAFFVIAGILSGYLLRITPLLPALLSLITFICAAADLRHTKKHLVRKPFFAIAALSFSFFAGMTAWSLHYGPNNRLHYTHFIREGSLPAIKGVLSERLKPGPYREKYYLEVLSANGHNATGTLLLTRLKDPAARPLLPGQVLTISGKPQPISRPLNPYRFDYAAYMEKQGVFHQLALKGNYLTAGRVCNFDYRVDRLRSRLMQSFAMHRYSPRVQQTLDALLFGQRQDMDAGLSESYKNAGVLHILAISGLHFTLLFYMFSLLLRPLGRLGRGGKLAGLIAMLTLLWGFAFLTGLPASVVRAVVMFSFISIGQYYNRHTSLYHSLAVSMLVLLLARPGFLFDAGFQLSYLAVFFIVWLEPLYRRARFSQYKAVHYITDTLLVSLAAQLGVLPLSLHYFGQFPLLFLAANAVVVPLSSLAVVLGLGVLALNFLWADAALLFGSVLGWCVEMMNGFIAWIASFDAVLEGIPFTPALTAALYAVIVLAIVWIYRKTYRNTLAALAAVLVMQVIYFYAVWEGRYGRETVIFHKRDGTLLGIKGNGSLTLLTHGAKEADADAVAYARASFYPSIETKPLRNTIWANGKKILVSGDSGYDPHARPDVLLLTHSAKLNLERALADLQPKLVVADGTNSRGSLERWKATCAGAGVPFHATAELGYCRFE